MVIEEEKQLATLGTGGVPVHSEARDMSDGIIMILSVTPRLLNSTCQMKSIPDLQR